MGKKNTKGYTLVEVMVVIMIMVILSTMLVTTMNIGGQLYRNDNAAMDAQSNARLAMSYLTMRIRQNDVSNGITVDTTYPFPVLTIKDSDPSNVGYTYWIYSDGVPEGHLSGKCGPGTLREQHGTVFDTTLGKGAEIANIGDFTVVESGTGIKEIQIEVKSVDGAANLKQDITLRSQ